MYCAAFKLLYFISHSWQQIVSRVEGVLRKRLNIEGASYLYCDIDGVPCRLSFHPCDFWLTRKFWSLRGKLSL